MRNTILLFIGMFILFCTKGQAAEIHGTVTDPDGQPIPLVNIQIKNTSIGTTSDENGQFKLENLAPADYVLSFSHIAFESKNVKIKLKENEIRHITISLFSETLALNKIVVISTRYEKQIQDVSLPLAVVPALEIAKSAPVTVSDVLQKEPGISLSRDGIWATDVNIRGLSKHNIVTLVDGNRLETASNIAAGLSLVDVTDISRIEVIKGAASSLYGSGAVGGVVNIITKGGHYSEAFHYGASLLSGYNSVNHGSTGRMAINAGNHAWYAKISGTFRDASDTKTPNGILDNSQFTDNNISANAGLKIAEKHELLLNYHRFYAEDVGIPGGKPFPANAKATYPEEKREMYSAQYRIKNVTSSLANLSLKYFHQYIFRDVELIPNPMLILRPTADHNTDGIQLETNVILGDHHHLVAGVDAWQRKLDSRRERIFQNAPKIIGETPIPLSTFRSIGIFAQDELMLLPNKLDLTLGGRLDRINVTNEQAFDTTFVIINGVKSIPAHRKLIWDENEVNDISWSANLGLLYSLFRDVDLSLTLGKSFRSPNLEERYQYILLGAATYLGNPDLNPEKGTFVDLGIRVWKPSLTFSGNIFLNSLNDLVIDRKEDENLFVKSNVGEAQLYGFDFGVQYHFPGKLTAYGSAAYVRGRDTGFDRDLPEIPPINGRIGLKAPVMRYFNVEAAANVFADQNFVAEGEMKTPGYTFYDLYINTVSFPLFIFNSRFTFAIENITDKAYRNHLASNRGLVSVEPGRNFKIQMQLLLD